LRKQLLRLGRAQVEVAFLKLLLHRPKAKALMVVAPNVVRIVFMFKLMHGSWQQLNEPPMHAIETRA
jgi:TRAP-type C4-dicarboxylate transport system permease small subunit